MIAVRVQGGLGNQIFQYAAARTLADGLGRDLGLDLRDFDDYARRRRLAALPLVGARLAAGDTPRDYLLDRYRVRARILGPWELLARGFPRSRGWRRRLGAAGLRRGRLVEEGRAGRGLAAEAAAADWAYLDGYWQSWRHFQGGRAALLGDLRLKAEASGPNAALLRRLKRAKAVAVHVRRGDYAALPAAAAHHGLLGAAYYRAALRRLGAPARGALFCVFSDEPDWARRHIGLPGPAVVVDHNPDRPEEDLRLMAACRHFIIANSSFSWWGAWMAEGPGKRVVAPRRWFKVRAEPPDLCPPEWIRL